MSPKAEQILALVTQSIVLQQQGDNDGALARLNDAHALAPDFPVTLVKRGTLLMMLGRPRAALADFDRAFLRKPEPHIAAERDAALQAAMGELEGKADAPSRAEYAALLIRLDRNAEAEASFRQAIAQDPKSHPGWVGLGNLLMRLNRFDEAQACYEAVLAFNPDDVIALFNRGNALQKNGGFVEALASYAAAATHRPDFAEIKMEQAHCQLALGNWQAGWPLFEARWKTKQLQGATPQTVAAQWQGERLDGTLFLWAEQGLGDTLQFLRYLPMAAEQAGQVVVRVQAALAALCREIAAGLANVTVLAQDDAIPPHDAHCPLMSLPLAFGTMPQSVPQSVPYVRVPADYAGKWKDTLGKKDKPRIAIVWSGGQRRLNNPTRDMPLSALVPLLDAIDADWLSLQKDVPDADAALLARHRHIRRMDAELIDFADTAAILAQTNLLITVDTAIAHLAGAMGRPVWLVLRKSSEWRWLGQSAETPWYPSLRQFRQGEHGNWQGPVKAMRSALAQEFA